MQIKTKNKLKSILKKRMREDNYLHDCKIENNLLSIRLVKMSILKNFLRNFVTTSKWQDDIYFDSCYSDNKVFSLFVRYQAKAKA